jgi:DNA-binding NarL/FixJ family response regulator
MKILIADDHRLIVEGVKTKLSELEHDVEFVVAMDIAELDAALRQPDCVLDLAIIDIGMPGAQGHHHIAQIRQIAPSMPVIVLSGSEDTELIHALLDLGVRGFIPKAYSPDVMLSAVRLVLSGGVYVPPILLAGVQARGWTPREAASVRATTSHPSLDGLRQVLTERQIDVMRLLSEGKPNKLIARDLGISEGTVKIHLAAIFRALNVRNRVEAVVASRRLVES